MKPRFWFLSGLSSFVTLKPIPKQTSLVRKVGNSRDPLGKGNNYVHG